MSLLEEKVRKERVRVGMKRGGWMGVYVVSTALRKCYYINGLCKTKTLILS